MNQKHLFLKDKYQYMNKILKTQINSPSTCMSDWSETLMKLYGPETQISV